MTNYRDRFDSIRDIVCKKVLRNSPKTCGIQLETADLNNDKRKKLYQKIMVLR